MLFNLLKYFSSLELGYIIKLSHLVIRDSALIPKYPQKIYYAPLSLYTYKAGFMADTLANPPNHFRRGVI